MEALRYEAPTTIERAVTLLADAPPEGARPLAGGTDLVVQMRSGRVDPALVVDLKRIPELVEIRLDAEGLWLGAAVPAAEVRAFPGLREQYPGLVEATHLIGSEQIQGRASVGGNLCNASPAADTTPALIACGARALIAGPAGRRELPVEGFVTAPGRNALGRGEFLVALQVPPPGRGRDAYLRLIPRTEMDIAVVGAGVRVVLDAAGRCDEARVALGAVAPTPVLAPAAAEALLGTTLDDAALERAARAAGAACDPIDDKRGTIDYRRKIAGVLVKRAARAAAERARAAANGSV